MFAHDAVEVPCPFDTVATRLRSPGWLRTIWETAIQRTAPASDHHADLGHSFQIGQPRTHAGSLLIPVYWEVGCDGTPAVAIDGDLEATPVDDVNTRLRLSATYAPPGSVDSAGCHALATASVSDALAGIAASLDRGATP
ncbi:MAG: hypothetical protein M5T61_06945 [Acidimicrobiia bacterium]|nr:hypothetical protein [Acidimicrobiia bacterium]